MTTATAIMPFLFHVISCVFLS